MKFTLRPYQQEMVNVAVKALQNSDKPFIIQAATGAGKSLVIAAICHALDDHVLVLQPSKELLEQNYSKMKAFGIDDVKIYSASAGSKEIGKYVMATIGSIYKKPELFQHFKYVVIDEADCVNPKEMDSMYSSFLQAIGCTKVCGLTATPYRLTQKYIQEGESLYYTTTLKMINRISYPTFWKDIKYKIETQDLIDQKFLSPIKYFVETPDTRDLKVNSTGADFTVESLEKFGQKRVARICQAIEYANANHKRVLVFCSSLGQANSVLDSFRASKLTIKLVDGKTPKKIREDSVASFKSGRTKVMLNVGVFLAGFDVPELDAIVFARPTLSPRVWYQAIGRGVRLDPTTPEKMLHVYDLVGVTKQLGRVETLRLGVEDGYKSTLESEVGRLDEVMLSKWFVKDRPKFVKGDKS